MQSPKRRLPSLHAIGRSRCVDLEDLPSEPAWKVDDLSSSFDESPCTAEQPCTTSCTSKEDIIDDERVFVNVRDGPVVRGDFIKDDEETDVESIPGGDVGVVETAVQATAVLRNLFQVVHLPGGKSFYCQRTADESVAFAHCPQAQPLASQYRNLDNLLAARAKLELMREAASQVAAASSFVAELRRLAVAETQMWHRIAHNIDDAGPPSTCLEQLNGLTDDLQLTVARWSTVKRRLLSDPLLQSELSSLWPGIDAVRMQLSSLVVEALFWTRRLIRVGFRILAHCDLDRISQESLWNIARGVEHFNSIVDEHRDHQERSSGSFLSVNSVGSISWRDSFRSRQRLRHHIDPIPLQTALRLMARERAKYAAVSAKDHFAANDEFLRTATKSRLPSPTFSYPTSTANPDEYFSLEVRTSDYSTLPQPAGTSPAVICDSSVAVPDLVGYPSPLIDFNRRETTFASRFLQVVCQSTTGLIPIHTVGSDSDDASDPKPTTAKSVCIAVDDSSFADLVESHSDVSSGTGRHRKCVSWGDASLAVAVQRTMHEYLNDIWRWFVERLIAYLVQLEWTSSRRGGSGRLGSIVLCPHTTLLILQRMLLRASLDGGFPVNCRPALATVALSLHAMVTSSVWDSAFNAALAGISASTSASSVVGGGVGAAGGGRPALAGVSSGRHASVAGQRLRDALAPLRADLQLAVERWRRLPDDVRNQSTATAAAAAADSAAVQDLTNVDRRLLCASLGRLQATCCVAVSYCIQMSQQFSTARSVEAYLLLMLGDLQTILDESRDAVNACKTLTTVSPLLNDAVPGSSVATVTGRNHLLEQIWRELQSTVNRLQALHDGFPKQFRQMCFISAKEFFAEEMPVGKEWKRRAGDGFPIQHSDYIESAMETLVQPALTGIGWLEPDSQALVLSTAMTAFCEAWTTHILTQKIRFSFLGACQLELDLLYVRTWLDSYISDASVRTAMSSHEGLVYMDAVISLLKQQPPVGKQTSNDQLPSSSPPSQKLAAKNNNQSGGSNDQSRMNGELPSRNSSLVGVNNSATRTQQSADSGTSSEASVKSDVSNGSDPSRPLPFRDQWLALRIQGSGSRNWSRFTACFNGSS